MSCADVMYQPYTPYFPYQRPPPTHTATASATAVATSAAELIPIAPYDVKAYTSGFQNWRGLSHMNTSHLPEGLFPLENLKHKFGVPKLPEPMEQGSPDFVSGNSMLHSPMNLASSAGTGTTSTTNRSTSSSVSSSSRAANSSTASAASSTTNDLSTDLRLSSTTAEQPPSAASRVSSSSSSSTSARSVAKCSAAPAPPSTAPTSDPAVKSEMLHATDAQYISANCVLFTYFSGDISTVVDEHFSRALSCSAQQSKGFVAKDTLSPMSQRNFPPSFWNSHYVYQGGASMSLASLGASHTHIHSHGHAHAHGHAHPELSYGGGGPGDPYHHAMHQADPWHYPLTSQSPYSHPAHRGPMHHELAAAYNGQSGFSPQYGSLLLQPPSVRSSRLGAAQCSSLGKPSDAHWSAAQRYHEHLTGSDIGSHLEAANYGGGHGYTSMCSMPEVEARGFFQTHESYN